MELLLGTLRNGFNSGMHNHYHWAALSHDDHHRISGRGANHGYVMGLNEVIEWYVYE